MIITYFGDGCFRLESGQRSVLIDPSGNRLKADVTVRTVTSSAIASVAPDEVSFPGEYEMRGVHILGVPLASESSEKNIKTAYTIKFEDISFAVLGSPARIFDPDLIEKLGEPDVVCLSLDGDRALSSEHAAKIIKQLGPHVVVVGVSKRATEMQKNLGQKGEALEKFVFKRKDIAEALERVVLLKS